MTLTALWQHSPGNGCGNSWRKEPPAGAFSRPHEGFLCLLPHRFCPIQPEMVFGHNLQHMAPFGVLTIAFCMVFQGTTLRFSAPGQILAPGADFSLGFKIWARAQKFGSQNGPWALWADDKPGLS